MTDTPEKPRVPMYAIISDPLPMQPEMFTALGEIVIHWSRVESAIDQELLTMRQWEIVRKLAEKLPHSFNKKLELWRKSIRALYPTIEDYQLYADSFEARAQSAAKLRNHLIHGMWALPENEAAEFHVMNFRSVKGKTRVEALWVGQLFLDNLLDEVKNISAVITGFTITKMMHAHVGLLRAHPASSPDHPAHLSPATPETPQEPPSSSEE